MADIHSGIEFTNDLRSFLADNGYSHIISIGVDDCESEPYINKGHYWLEPLKKTIIEFAVMIPIIRWIKLAHPNYRIFSEKSRTGLHL